MEIVLFSFIVLQVQFKCFISTRTTDYDRGDQYSYLYIGRLLIESAPLTTKNNNHISLWYLQTFNHSRLGVKNKNIAAFTLFISGVIMTLWPYSVFVNNPAIPFNQCSSNYYIRTFSWLPLVWPRRRIKNRSWIIVRIMQQWQQELDVIVREPGVRPDELFKDSITKSSFKIWINNGSGSGFKTTNVMCPFVVNVQVILIQ